LGAARDARCAGGTKVIKRILKRKKVFMLNRCLAKTFSQITYAILSLWFMSYCSKSREKLVDQLKASSEW
jgi:hypothetical protein